MPVAANEFPADWRPGSDYIEIHDEEFDLVSEPQGLIAVRADNDMGYLTIAAAERLLVALTAAIANSKAPRPKHEDDGDDDATPI